MDPTDVDDQTQALPTDTVEEVPQFLWRFAKDQHRLRIAAEELRQLLTEFANEASIEFHSIESRHKSIESYETKALKEDAPGSRKYSDPASEITDCIAARVILFTSRARDDLAEILSTRTVVSEQSNPGEAKHNGYDSEHFIITSIIGADYDIRYNTLTSYLEDYPGLEIQLRSVAAHAWAEYEHDVRYKSTAYTDATDDIKGRIDQWFVEAGGLRRLMDNIFDDIQNLLYPVEAVESITPESGASIEVADAPDVKSEPLTSLDDDVLYDHIRERHPERQTGGRLAVGSIRQQLDTLGVQSLEALEAAEQQIDPGRIAELMDYPFEATGGRVFDDELLAIFKSQWVESAKDDDRRRLLRLRLRRVSGKFSIYEVRVDDATSRPVPAAHAVRQLAKAVADLRGTQAALVAGAIALQPGDLPPSTSPRKVETDNGDLYVATNLTRRWAESIMESLMSAARGERIELLRAGDRLFS